MSHKHCPFCGWNTTQVYGVLRQDREAMTYAIYCDTCGASGPQAPDPQVAIALWNERHAVVCREAIDAGSSTKIEWDTRHTADDLAHLV